MFRRIAHRIVVFFFLLLARFLDPEWVDEWAARYLQAGGTAVYADRQVRALQGMIRDSRYYVDRSGHLNTVSGRKPRAVHRIRQSLDNLNSGLRIQSIARGPKGRVFPLPPTDTEETHA